MNFDDFKKKASEFNWKQFFLGRNFIIICCVMLLGAGVIVYSVVADRQNKDVKTGGTKNLGNSVLVGSQLSGDGESVDPAAAPVDGDSFFAVQIINRERTRGEALDVLQTIADSADAMPDAKEEALISISAMVSEMNAEANIETLVKSKGFEECIAIISDKQCMVIVKADVLDADEVAQILEIAVEQTGFKANAIKIRGSEQK